jgi:hypothetical protein
MKKSRYPTLYVQCLENGLKYGNFFYYKNTRMLMGRHYSIARNQYYLTPEGIDKFKELESKTVDHYGPHKVYWLN